MSTRKIAVVGPESTGKSTLSEALAKELQTLWVPEYARAYLETLGRDYEETDLLTIAQGQAASEDTLFEKAGNLLICDTELNIVRVWSEHKYRRVHKWILEEIAQRKYDLYLLTYIDTPWQHDPQREHPEPAMRAYFYNIYRDIVLNSNVPWADVRGTHGHRMQTALQAINALR